MQRFEIWSGDNIPPGHRLAQDGESRVVDLSGLAGTLHGPTIDRMVWSSPPRSRPYGVITLKDGTSRRFFDKGLLDPYINAFRVAAAQS